MCKAVRKDQDTGTNMNQAVSAQESEESDTELSGMVELGRTGLLCKQLFEDCGSRP